MDLGAIAQRSVEIVVTQGSAVVSGLVLDRLRDRQESDSAAVALRENPGDAAAQSAACDALLQILQEDRDLAHRLEAELRQLEPSSNTVTSYGSGTAGVIHQQGTRNQSHIGDVNKKVSKRGGAFWGIVAAVVVIVGGGAAVLIVQNNPDPTPQEGAEKTAVDFANASFGGDVTTMCGLVAKGVGNSNLSACDSEEGMQSAQKEADENRADIERSGLGKGWSVQDSKLPSDNHALVTLRHTKVPTPVMVDMTHETGDWRVTYAGKPR